MRYSRENAFRMLEEAQGMKIQVKLASKNPNFTLQDKNRPMFYNHKYANDNPTKTKIEVIKELKQGWHDQHFANDYDYAKFIESSVLSGSLTLVKDKDRTYEEYRNVNYIYVEVDGEKKYYFVNTMYFTPNDLVEYELYLDSITTYLDRLEYNGQTKVERTHWDRLIDKSGDVAFKEANDKADTLLPITINDFITAPHTAGYAIDFPKLTAQGIDMNSPDYNGNFYIDTADAVNGDNRYILVITTTHGRKSGIPINQFNIVGGLFDNGKSEKTDRFVDFTTAVKNEVEFTMKIRPDGHGVEVLVKMDASSDYYTGGSANIEGIAYLGLRSISSGLAGQILTYKLDNDSPVWNEDGTVNVKTKINVGMNPAFHETAKLGDQRDAYNEYRKLFNLGSEDYPKYAYLLKQPDSEFSLPEPTWDSNIGYSGGSLVSFLIPLHNNGGVFTWQGHEFGQKNYLFNLENLGDAKSNGIILTDYPLEWFKDWFVKFKDTHSAVPDKWYVKTRRTFRDTMSILKFENPMFMAVDINKVKLDDDRNIELEPKLKSNEYLKLTLYGPTDEDKDLVNYKLATWMPQMKLGVGVIATETKTMNVYNLQNTYLPEIGDQIKDKEKLFMTTNFEQLASLSDPYKNYMNSHMSSYQTGISNNDTNRIFGLVKSGMTANPFGIASTLITAANKEKVYKAQVEDLKRQGQKPLGNGASLARDIVVQKDLDLKYGLGLMKYELPSTMKKTVYDHFTRYGYVVDRLMVFNGYEDFARRYRFTHWEIANFSNAIDKTNISNEILQDINSAFDDGITLWSVRNEKGDTEINDYSKENWENFIAERLT